MTKQEIRTITDRIDYIMLYVKNSCYFTNKKKRRNSEKTQKERLQICRKMKLNKNL